MKFVDRPLCSKTDTLLLGGNANAFFERYNKYGVANRMKIRKRYREKRPNKEERTEKEV